MCFPSARRSPIPLRTIPLPGTRRAQPIRITVHTGQEAGRRRQSARPLFPSGFHPAAVPIGDAGRHRRKAVPTRRPPFQVPEHSPTPFPCLQPGALSHRTASKDACYYKYDVTRIQRRPECRRSGFVTGSVSVAVTVAVAVAVAVTVSVAATGITVTRVAAPDPDLGPDADAVADPAPDADAVPDAAADPAPDPDPDPVPISLRWVKVAMDPCHPCESVFIRVQNDRAPVRELSPDPSAEPDLGAPCRSVAAAGTLSVNVRS